MSANVCAEWDDEMADSAANSFVVVVADDDRMLNGDCWFGGWVCGRLLLEVRRKVLLRPLLPS